MRRHIYLLFTLSCLLSACGSAPGPAPEPAAINDAVVSTRPASSVLVALGKTGEASGIAFTVRKISTPSQIAPGSGGPEAEAGETFVVVSYTLKNTSAQLLPSMERPELALIDGKGQTYAPDNAATVLSAMLMDDASGMSADLNPNVSAKSKAAWKVDKAAFDRSTWRLTLTSDPQLTFALR